MQSTSSLVKTPAGTSPTDKATPRWTSNTALRTEYGPSRRMKVESFPVLSRLVQPSKRLDEAATWSDAFFGFVSTSFYSNALGPSMRQSLLLARNAKPHNYRPLRYVLIDPSPRPIASSV